MLPDEYKNAIRSIAYALRMDPDMPPEAVAMQARKVILDKYAKDVAYAAKRMRERDGGADRDWPD